MKRIIVILLFMLSYNLSFGEDINNNQVVKQDVKLIKDDNLEQFKRMSLLKSVLDHCSDDGINFEDEKTLNSIVNFNKFLIMKNKIDSDTIIKIITESDIMVQDKFYDAIPANICFDAIDYTNGLINSSDEFKVYNIKSQYNNDKTKIKE